MRNFYKKICILLIVFWTKLIFAQAITENFDNITTLTGSGWVMQNSSVAVGSTSWFQGNPTSAGGPFDSYNGVANSYIGANYNNTGNVGTISNWLMTPNRTFRNGDVITFYTRKPSPDTYADRLEIRLSTNGASTNSGSGAGVGDFTTLLLSINPNLTLGVYPTSWTQYTITISGLSAPTSGRVAFRYFVTSAGLSGTNSDYIGIDAFTYTPYVCPAFTMTTSGALTGGTAGSFYSTTLTQTGALGTPNFAITAGALPPGLTLSSSGTISGTPTATGTFNFTATVNDASGCSGSQSYSITVVCPPNPITIADFPVLCSNSGLYTLTGASPVGGTYSGTGVSGGQFNPAVGTQTITYDYTDPYGCPHTLSKTITVNPEQSITTQPSASTICAGANTTFSVTATNATGYQWQVDQGSGFTNITNSAPYSGVTTATLTVTGSTAGMNGYLYRVVVSGATGCNSKNSNNVALTVNSAPAITAQPSASTICAGANTTFSATAINATGYQWQVDQGAGFTSISNNAIYSGTTTATLTITGATAGLNGYLYRVVATGACTPNATSNSAALTVNSAPAITAQPSASTICAGANTTFSATAINATGYQWQVDQGAGFTSISNNAIYSGTTTATLTITGATAGLNGYLYRVVATGACTPNATSNSAALTVNSAPAITAQPSASTICAGATTTFSVTASNATGYQWQVDQGLGFANITNAAPYSGAATATLTITGATAGMNGYLYRVVTTGACTPNATSNSAALTVNSAPVITTQPSASTICAGSNTTFTTTASSATGYQWQVDQGTGFNNISNNAIYSGATTSTLTITAATAGMTGYLYRVVASGVCTPNATSNSVALTVSLVSGAVSQTNVSCNGGANGTITLTPSGGTTPYTFEWNDGIITQNRTGLIAGTYTVTIKDANNCTGTASVTITEPTALVATASAQTNVACNGSNTGSATVGVTGGTGAYTYSWSPSGGTAATANGLVAGTYTVTVTDANNCQTTQSFTITEPTVLIATASAQTNVACNGSATGSATVGVTGGTGAYTYSWSPSGGTGATANGLVAGTYTVTVTDANNCQTTQSFTITEPTALVATAAAQTNIACNGSATGSATVSVTGGTGAYTYSWSPSGGTGSTANGLVAGTYTVTVTDANNCQTTQSFTITEAEAVLAPIGATTQTFNVGDSLSVLVVNGQNIKWYATESDATSHINDLPISTLIVNNTTYYATQTVDGCESKTSLAVLAWNEDMGVINTDGKTKIQIYPNPVKEVLHFAGEDKINKIVIVSIDGKKVSEKKMNGERKLNVHTLVQGTYLINIFTENGVQTIKFIKN